MTRENFNNIKVIGFDADDTLWVNETFFREAEDEFYSLLSCYETKNKLKEELFRIEIKNLDLYGYGVKGFVLSMIECASIISNGKLDQEKYTDILNIGKEMLNKPVELLEGVEEVLEEYSKTHRVLLLTKGDLLDQERKLEKSGLSKYFHHVEVLSNKYSKNYKELLEHLDIPANEFLMVGNSLKSDVLPLLDIGASAIHIPFHTTWEHEEVKETPEQDYLTLDSISKLREYI